jgi:hypothetical protein
MYVSVCVYLIVAFWGVEICDINHFNILNTKGFFWRGLTNAAISKATLMSFPLVGNLSEKPRRIADKPQ